MPDTMKAYAARDTEHGADTAIGRSLDVLHHQIVGADIVQRADMGMIQRRDRARLALEAITSGEEFPDELILVASRGMSCAPLLHGRCWSGPTQRDDWHKLPL